MCSVSIGLAILSPSAACLGVGALHVCGVAVSLDVIRVAGCIVASTECTCSIAVSVSCHGCKNCDGN